MKLIFVAFVFFHCTSFGYESIGRAPHPPRYRGPSGGYPFHQAVYEGDIERVYKLIKKADINQKDNYHGKAPIHWAIQKELPRIRSRFQNKAPTQQVNRKSDVYVKIISVLIENGVDIEVRGRRDKTALMFAAQLGDKNIIKALLKHGANLHAKNKYSKQTPLSYAIHRCCNPNGEIVSFLIENGADPQVREGRNNKTFLHRVRNEKIALILIKHGPGCQCKR